MNVYMCVLTYVDLALNVDGYTGYKGEEAGRVWRAIYHAKNGFNNNNITNAQALRKREMEERVLFRLISGFHTLTSAMVFANYPQSSSSNNGIDPSGHNVVYGYNLEMYERFLHPNPSWIQNLYFDFVFLLRAVNKASPVLDQYYYDTGNATDDAFTKGLIHQLVSSNFIQQQCSVDGSFDESQMFRDDPVDLLSFFFFFYKYVHIFMYMYIYHQKGAMDGFRRVFRNISEILDCVGCEKCKLHAKVMLHKHTERGFFFFCLLYLLCKKNKQTNYNPLFKSPTHT
ncbi:hypothetical protein RFI_05322 [Reticulomyxa filosa]|uniref:Uncharacterized protein n=1 Tax=Reticulomyxa filosa TaxID=46433 RepID=X6P2L1_RETFI|nr:hypothetical protein RFI_05322 [Reticulomyxa filosa]|eukprot:ETO31797.1 hypothetical protein RFI_05322 [Reticulomyxa filosa]